MNTKTKDVIFVIEKSHIRNNGLENVRQFLTIEDNKFMITQKSSPLVPLPFESLRDQGSHGSVN